MVDTSTFAMATNSVVLVSSLLYVPLSISFNYHSGRRSSREVVIVKIYIYRVEEDSSREADAVCVEEAEFYVYLLDEVGVWGDESLCDDGVFALSAEELADVEGEPDIIVEPNLRPHNQLRPHPHHPQHLPLLHHEWSLLSPHSLHRHPTLTTKTNHT